MGTDGIGPKLMSSYSTQLFLRIAMLEEAVVSSGGAAVVEGSIGMLSITSISAAVSPALLLATHL